MTKKDLFNKLSELNQKGFTFTLAGSYRLGLVYIEPIALDENLEIIPLQKLKIKEGESDRSYDTAMQTSIEKYRNWIREWKEKHQ